MNDNAKAWVAALRSGEFKQGMGALREGDEFCCLGVACELAAREGITNAEEPPSDPLIDNIWHYGGENGVLPPEVTEWLGLRTNCGAWQEGIIGGSLASQNDNGASFDEIAAIIESERPGLFA